MRQTEWAKLLLTDGRTEKGCASSSSNVLRRTNTIEQVWAYKEPLCLSFHIHLSCCCCPAAPLTIGHGTARNSCGYNERTYRNMMILFVSLLCAYLCAVHNSDIRRYGAGWSRESQHFARGAVFDERMTTSESSSPRVELGLVDQNSRGQRGERSAW